MAQETHAVSRPRVIPALRMDRVMAWLGVSPFFIFAVMFLILPTVYLFVGTFQDSSGSFTLVNIGQLFTPSILSAYWISIEGVNSCPILTRVKQSSGSSWP